MSGAHPMAQPPRQAPAKPGAPTKVTASEAIRRAAEHLNRNELDAAAKLAAAVLSRRPKHPAASQILASIAEKKGDPERAILILKSALTGGAADAVTQMNLCRIYRLNGRTAEAQAAGEASLAIGTAPEVFVDMAELCMTRGDNDLALSYLEVAIAKVPDLARAHLALAHALLIKGEFRQGWAEYEWRYKLPKTRQLLPPFKQPQWNGMQLKASRLFILCEQGYGDCFQFARYLPLVAARVKEVVVGASVELMPVLSRIPGPKAYYDRWENLPGFEFQTTLSSLPHLMGTTLDTVPAKPYLSADPVKVDVWKRRLAEKAQGKKTVGIVWHGRPANAINDIRSVPLGALTPLLEMDGVLPVSLQVGAGSEQLAQHPARTRVLDVGRDLVNFGETAAVMTALDHVVTIETASAHLVGGLGRPAFVMLSKVADWRWLEERSDSPWYPSLELVRQTEKGDWAGVVRRIVAKLQA